MKVYDVIIDVADDDKTLLQTATEFLHGFDFSECETTEEDIKYKQYVDVDTFSGVSMYYDYGADYFFFVED